MLTIDDPTVKARLSLQRALLGEVSERLRAVVFSATEASLIIRFYIDGEVREEDKESASTVESEVLADYEPNCTVVAKCVRMDVPTPILDDGIWAFRRREVVF